jgi:hypothetical protein
VLNISESYLDTSGMIHDCKWIAAITTIEIKKAGHFRPHLISIYLKI